MQDTKKYFIYPGLARKVRMSKSSKDRSDKSILSIVDSTSVVFLEAVLDQLWFRETSRERSTGVQRPAGRDLLGFRDQQ